MSNFETSCETCKGGIYTKYHISLKESDQQDVLNFFHQIKPYIESVLSSNLAEKKGIKWFLCIQIEYIKQNVEGENVYSNPFFRSFVQISVNNTVISDQINNAFSKIIASAHDFHREGSDWVFHRILGFDICIAIYQPLHGSSYIELPRELKSKHAIVNIHNNDNKCFIYSVLAGVDNRHHLHPNRVKNYLDMMNTVNIDGLSFPVTVNQIDKFENNNNISINVFGYEKEIFPIRITQKRGLPHVNLLLISEQDKQHYCLIKHFSRLMGNRTKNTNKTFYCNYCLHGYSKEKMLKEHIPMCDVHGTQKTSLPTPTDNILCFKNYEKQLKCPFVIYADWETFPEKISTAHPDTDKSFTSTTHKHEPNSFCYLIVSVDSRYYRKPVLYRGPNAVRVFIEQLQREVV